MRETTRENQTDRVLKYILDFGSINPLQALSDLGVMRLGARIFDLKKQGYAIESEMTESRNRYGDKVHFSTYRISEE